LIMLSAQNLAWQRSAILTSTPLG